MLLEEKLAILADAAKYDVSCASSGSARANTPGGIGNAAVSGICHSFTEDGRCVSLLKILFSNFCIYNCEYCINRAANDIARAAFTAREVIDLTINFYRRNYIEGLFLSSGVIRSPDDTMLRLVDVVRGLRAEGFNGYIHLKCVPHASRELIELAGLHADRLSINIELPSEMSLKQLTHEKTYPSIIAPMEVIRDGIAQVRDDRRNNMRHTPTFAPGGQSTQMIVGATPESDFDILTLADGLYKKQELRRVYYSAYIDTAQVSREAGAKPPLRREHRLYQADWLLRFYHFALDEIISPQAPNLDLSRDPKHAYALAHPHFFPVDINRADYETILRVPGIGVRSAKRILWQRRRGRIRFEHLRSLGLVVSRALPFLICDAMPGASPAHQPGAARPGTALGASPQGAQGSGQGGFQRPQPGLLFVTDGSFEGLLCAIFASYGPHGVPWAVLPAAAAGQAGFFERRVDVATDPAVAQRVWLGMGKHLGQAARTLVLHAFLSCDPGVQTLVCHGVRARIPGKSGRLLSADPALGLALNRLAAKVRREAHRLLGFARFQEIATGRFLAFCAPRYDVLGLTGEHFMARFGDQEWILYDTARAYGLSHTGERVTRLPQDYQEAFLRSGRMSPADGEACAQEARHQELWQAYTQAVTIAERANSGLEHGKLPARYWQYLTEKKGRGPGRKSVAPAMADTVRKEGLLAL